MRYLLFVLLMFNLLSAQIQRTDRLVNTKLMRADTLWLVADTTLYTPIFWQTRANEKAVEIVMDDTSSAGHASDSIGVDVVLKQVFDRGTTKTVNLYTSTAYTSGLVFDSITLADLDTASTWARATAPILKYNRDTTGYYATDALDTVTTSEASTYIQLVPDYSPGLVFAVTGTADNKKGSANMVIIRWYQQMGLPVFDD